MMRSLVTAVATLSVSTAPVVTIGLAIALTACGGKSEDARRADIALTRGENPPGLTMTVCGSVVSYVASDATRHGTIQLDRGAWQLLPAAPVAFEVLLRPGERVCVHAALDTAQRIQGAYVFRMEDEQPDIPLADEAGAEDAAEGDVTPLDAP